MNYRSIPLFICCIFLTSCAGSRTVTVTQDEDTDLACSYFYFLWGTHAEFQLQYPEALEAYEKALICDQHAEYIKEKLPLLLLKMGKDERAVTLLEAGIETNPGNDNYRFFLANIYVQQNKTDKAIALYNELLKRSPENEGVQLRLGLLYTHQKQFEIAEKVFRKLLSKNNSSYFSRLYLARLLSRTKKDQKAEEEYQKALALNWSKELAYEIGQFYTSRKKFNDALRIYTTITQNDPLDEKAALSRVQALLDLSQNEKALKELESIKPISSNPDKIDIIISKILLRENDINRAKSILQKLSKKQHGSEPDYLLALLAFQENDFNKAHKYLKTITSDEEQFEDAVYLQSRIFRKEGQIDAAINVLKKHIAEDPSRSPLFYALLSVLYQDKGENGKAITLMDSAVALYPDNPQLFFEYGLLLERSGKTKQAMTTMQKVLKLQSNHPEALNFIGYTWADNNIHLDQALQYIQQAIALKPDNGYIMDSLGWVYYRLGKLDKAAVHLERSIELQPGDPHIYDHLGDVYRAQKNYSKALDIYSKAYQMFKSRKKKSAVKKKINALRKK